MLRDLNIMETIEQLTGQLRLQYEVTTTTTTTTSNAIKLVLLLLSWFIGHCTIYSNEKSASPTIITTTVTTTATTVTNAAAATTTSSSNAIKHVMLVAQGLSGSAFSGVMKSLHLMIRQKCDVDRCIITLSIPARYLLLLLQQQQQPLLLQCSTWCRLLDNTLCPINEVTQRRDPLVPGWVTDCGQVNYIGGQQATPVNSASYPEWDGKLTGYG